MTEEKLFQPVAFHGVAKACALRQMSAITTVYHTGNPNESKPAITFKNVYTPDPAVITIGIEKKIDNKTDKDVSLKGFKFEIALDKDTYTAASDENGNTAYR